MGKRLREGDIDDEGRKVKKSKKGPKNAVQRAAAEQKAAADPSTLRNKDKYKKKGNKETKQRFRQMQREFEEASAAFEEGRAIKGEEAEDDEQTEEVVDEKKKRSKKDGKKDGKKDSKKDSKKDRKKDRKKDSENDDKTGDEVVMENGDVAVEKLSMKAEKKKRKREEAERKAAEEKKAAEKVNLEESKAEEEEEAGQKDEDAGDETKVEDDEDGITGPKKPQRFIIFVGNLPYTATKESMQAHFAAYHPTDVRCLHKRDDSSQCRGCGFIEFNNVRFMKSCLDKLHHSMFKDGKSAPRKINLELTAGGGGKKDNRMDKIRQKNKDLSVRRARKAQMDRDAKDAKRKDQTDKKKAEGGGMEDMHPSRRARLDGDWK